MLRVPSNLTLAKLDELTVRLAGASSRELQVPSSALRTTYGSGLDGPLIQFLATWRRQHDDAELYLAGEETSKVLENLLKHPHGIAALYFSKKVRFLNGNAQESKLFLKQFLPRLRAMQSGAFRDTIGQRGCHLASFAGAANEWLEPLYPSGDSSNLLLAERFPKLLRKMIAAFDPTVLNLWGNQNLDDLAHVFYELFDNTHQHGRRNLVGDIQVPSMRGVVTRRFDYRLEPIQGIADIGKPFFKYVSSMVKSQRPITIVPEENVERFKENLIGSHRKSNSLSLRGFPFLELTVYDTGVGIASHLGSLDAIDSESDTLALLQLAFSLGRSSKSIRGGGNGLPSVLAGLNRMKGFLVLRTSGISLYQDFSLANSSGFNPEILGVFNSNLAKNPVGTSFSLLIPLGAGKQ
jgi:hypothetical protein